MNTNLKGFLMFFQKSLCPCALDESGLSNGAKLFENHLNPVMLVFSRSTLTEYSQMSTHLPGFRSFFRFFCIILY